MAETKNKKTNKKNQSITIIFLITCLILLVMVGFVMLTSWLRQKYFGQSQGVLQQIKQNNLKNSADGKMVDWNTYSNNEFKYSIQYPGAWNQGEMNLGGQKVIVLTPAPISQIGTQVDAVTITVLKNNSNLSARKYFEQMIKPEQEGSVCTNPTINPSNPTSLHGIDAVIIEGTCGVLSQGPRAVIAHNGYVIDITSSFTGKIDNDLVNQMLSTFSFMK